MVDSSTRVQKQVDMGGIGLLDEIAGEYFLLVISKDINGDLILSLKLTDFINGNRKLDAIKVSSFVKHS